MEGLLLLLRTGCYNSWCFYVAADAAVTDFMTNARMTKRLRQNIAATVVWKDPQTKQH